MDGDMQSGRLDPERLDATAKRRPRAPRNVPEPSAELKAWGKAAEARAKARPHPPGIIMEPAGGDREHWTAPHSDVDLWTLQLADAFGTRSIAIVDTFMHQLEALCRESHWDEDAQQWRLDEHEYSAIIGIVSATKPRNELEAAQAAQMVAVHLLTMKLAARALKYDGDVRTAATVAKLARTFTLQMEALRAGRSRKPATRQTITVKKELHQHVHYHRGDGENIGQPHEAGACKPAKRAALSGEEPRGKMLPLPRRKGKTGL